MAFCAFVSRDGNTGTFTDPRDGKTYKTVRIGSQIWMAENLNYEFLGSYSVNGDTEGKLGRLYTRKVAMAICPEGWHVPCDAEWEELRRFVSETLFRGDKDFAGYALKAKSGWEKGVTGTDAFGFGALPAGFCDKQGGNFKGVRDHAYFWSASMDDDDFVYFRSLSASGTGLDRGREDFCHGSAMSVRCVKD